MSWEIDPLFGDWYAGDGDIDFSKLVAAGPPWHGAILKATQGAHYDGGSWFQKHWPAVKNAAGDRYGQDFFRGCYLYIDFSISPDQQVDLFMQTVDRAGGFSYGDLAPIVDVERGGQRASLTKTLVEDTTSTVVELLHAATGEPIILYGGELIRSLEITSKMGCHFAWVAEYASHLDPSIYTKMGFSLEEVLFFQYCGKNNGTSVDCYLKDYPCTTPSGLADISAAIIAGGGQNAIDFIRRTFCVVPF